MTYNFEINITVSEDSKEFRNACISMGARYSAGGGRQPMSSWTNNLEHHHALDMMKFQIRYLETFGCEVIRAKLESDLTHPSCNFKLPNQYFESHIQVKVKEYDLPSLAILAKDFRLHLSSNAFKINDIDQVRMLTYRSYTDSPQEFQVKVKNYRWQIAKHYELVKKMECEFALYDTNVNIDEEWINGSTGSFRTI